MKEPQWLRCQCVSLSIILLLFFHIEATAQEGLAPPNIVPPSPTVSSLIKYSDIPVSYATGVPQIEIPIYEIKGKEISLPIALSYHAGGLKVDEKPGWLGLSWSLTGANGVISRTIHGLPDSDGKGYIANFDSLNQSTISEDLQDLILAGEIDSDPDEYSYNFAGRSGKLIFTQDSIVTVPFENLSVAIAESDAGITTEQGVVYSFAATEKYENDAHVEFTQSWHLTSIANSNQTEVISFDYTTPFVVTDPYEPSMMVRFYTAGCQTKDPIIVDKGQTRHEIRLSKITFEETDLRFYGQLRLDSIVVFESNVRIKKFTMEYMSDLLSTVTEVAINQTGHPHGNILRHSMSYFPLAVSKFAKDHWGYQNGAGYNTHLFPVTLNSIPAANRESSAAPGVQTSGALREITYPTGGTVTFEYEPNGYWQGGGPHYTSLGQVNDHVWFIWNDTMSADPISESRFFTLEREEQVSIDIRSIYNDGVGEGNMVDEGQTMIFKVFEVGNPTALYTYNAPTGALVISAVPQFLTLEAGDYEARITITPVLTSLITSMMLEANVRYNKYILNETGETTAGGIRIKKITTHDGMSNSPDQIRSFKYTSIVLDSVEHEVSSGWLSLNPVYTYSYVEWMPMFDNPTITQPCTQYAVTNGEEALAGMGSPVYYTEVTELLGPNGEFGKNRYFFEPGTSAGSGYPYPPREVDFRAGLPDSTMHYKSTPTGFELVRKSRIFYEFNELPHKHSIQGVKVMVLESNPGLQGPGDEVVTDYLKYKMSTSWFHPTRKTETTYVNGEETLEKVVHYTYDPVHVQLARTEENNSDGSFTIQELEYPDNFTGTDATLVAMKAAQMPGKVIRQVTKRRDRDSTVTIINSIINRFETKTLATSTTGIVLRELYKLKATEPLAENAITFNPSTPFYADPVFFERKLTFDEYDNFGNPLQYTPENNIHYSYLWDCERRRPIAEVINATRSTICFTGFECNDYGGWTLSGGSATSGSGGVVTGEHAWHDGQLTKTSLPSGSYTVTLWAKGSGTVAVNGVSKNVDGTWRSLEWKVTTSGTITVSSNGNVLDEVRLMPVGSQMTTYTYDDGGRITSATDINNRHTFYEYDEFKRLRAIRNHDREFLNLYEYHYQN